MHVQLNVGMPFWRSIVKIPKCTATSPFPLIFADHGVVVAKSPFVEKLSLKEVDERVYGRDLKLRPVVLTTTYS